MPKKADSTKGPSLYLKIKYLFKFAKRPLKHYNTVGFMEIEFSTLYIVRSKKCPV